jgi:hypothetical protein
MDWDGDVLVDARPDILRVELGFGGLIGLIDRVCTCVLWWCCRWQWVDGSVDDWKANATQPVTSTNFPRRDRPSIITKQQLGSGEEAEWKPSWKSLHEPRPGGPSRRASVIQALEVQGCFGRRWASFVPRCCKRSQALKTTK